MILTRHDEKGERFKKLVARIEEALIAKYYIEAMSISYALIEERTDRLLDILRIPSKHTLNLCLLEVKKKIDNKDITVPCKRLTETAFVKLLDETFVKTDIILPADEGGKLHAWRKKRNDVTHALAEADIDYESLAPIAIDGNRIFREYSAAIMRIKKEIV